MVPLQDQFYYFILTILIGMVAGFCYDLYKVTRGTLRLRKIGTALGDIFFWLILTGVVFILLLLGNWGEVRLYVLLGLLLGAVLYLNVFSHLTTTMIHKIFKTLRQIWIGILKTLSFLWKMICLPFKGLYLLVALPLGFIVHLMGKTVTVSKRIMAKLFGGPMKKLKGGFWKRLVSIFPVFEYKNKK
ncbi:hypothetical protein Dred_0119 [Desulforamulus reducens MI-1]|uniref:Spore cortex biosynthesis protein YabQ n=1 Tax=Desulforamulus reducens (strain ATCC BAA-1160 / DSM 100696 / MI-1) TaxID=349161 RepID=A4J0R6_DESRM|nr:hypothetical protein Dred_0119 [Desulforamulus reducens MI-1]